MNTLKITALLALAAPVAMQAAPKFAVYGNNAIINELNSHFGAGSASLVTASELDTAGFLNSFQAFVFTRDGASFGNFLDPIAAANVTAYVGAANTPGQGGVALFTNDMADNLPGGGDPLDVNLTALFNNAATFAAASGHGFIGEFQGAEQALSGNGSGATPLDLITGFGSNRSGYGPQFVYGVGPVGPGNPIDAGVVFPFTDADGSTFLTRVSGALPGNIVDVYTSSGIDGDPAVLANDFVIHGGNAPDGANCAMLFAVGAGVLLAFRARKHQTV